MIGSSGDGKLMIIAIKGFQGYVVTAPGRVRCASIAVIHAS
jgi:hypothetical protein